MRTLREDHARQTRVLWVIEELAPQLRADPESTRPALLEAMRFLRYYQHVWHHPREDQLFARISRRDPGHRADLRELMREHRGGLRGVKALVDGLAQASPAQLRRSEGKRLTRGLHRYVAHLREHVRHEERAFYARAESALDATDWQALAAEAAPEDPLADADRLAREYPHLAGRLANSERVLASDAVWRGVARSAEASPSAAYDRVTRLVEIYGELLHDGFDLLRENLDSARAVHSPADLWRVATPICRRSGVFALRCFTMPAQFVGETARDVAASTFSFRRPASGKR